MKYWKALENRSITLWQALFAPRRGAEGRPVDIESAPSPAGAAIHHTKSVYHTRRAGAIAGRISRSKKSEGPHFFLPRQCATQAVRNRAPGPI